MFFFISLFNQTQIYDNYWKHLKTYLGNSLDQILIPVKIFLIRQFTDLKITADWSFKTKYEKNTPVSIKTDRFLFVIYYKLVQIEKEKKTIRRTMDFVK